MGRGQRQGGMRAVTCRGHLIGFPAMGQQEGRWRARVRGALEDYFARRSYPRQALALLIVVTGLMVVVVVAIVGAPALLAEVFLDVFIATVLYRRLKKAVKGNWLGKAIRKTWGLALCTAALLGLVGWVLQQMAPGAQSIGSAIGELFE